MNVVDNEIKLAQDGGKADAPPDKEKKKPDSGPHDPQTDAKTVLLRP